MELKGVGGIPFKQLEKIWYNRWFRLSIVFEYEILLLMLDGVVSALLPTK